VGKLLSCSPNSISTQVLELVQQRDTMANRIQELEEKRFSLEKDCEGAQHDVVYLKSEVQPLEIKVDSIKRERDQLQEVGPLQKEENEQSARQLKNARAALVLEEGIQKSLAVAAEAAKMILEVDKVQLIQKQLEHLYKGEAQSFMKLYKSTQHLTMTSYKFKRDKRGS
jgi:chromosome segregation ATPase